MKIIDIASYSLLLLMSGAPLRAEQNHWVSVPQPQFPDEGLSRNPTSNEQTGRIQARPRIRILPLLSTSPSGYSPSQVRHAYGFDKLAAGGSGQIIAIVDAYGSPSIQTDLNAFCTKYGLPATTVKVYYPQGKPGANSGWALETSLDVEWAHAIAPQATIVLVVAKSSSLSDLLGGVDYAVQLGARQVSMSWGGSEFSAEGSYDSHFNKVGVSFFASSGDGGAGVIWPATSPFVTAVGGTTLKLDSSFNVLSETGWSGSGGGVSAYENRPACQANWVTTSRRNVPDVSYAADPNTGVSVYISNYNGATGWVTVGGTSAGAPQWAALAALANSGRAASLLSSNNSVYGLANAAYSNYFRDITLGSNGNSCTVRYDRVTGLGSPFSSTLIPALHAY
jgi:subtilase family serine protease